MKSLDVRYWASCQLITIKKRTFIGSRLNLALIQISPHITSYCFGYKRKPLNYCYHQKDLYHTNKKPLIVMTIADFTKSKSLLRILSRSCGKFDFYLHSQLHVLFLYNLFCILSIYFFAPHTCPQLGLSTVCL